MFGLTFTMYSQKKKKKKKKEADFQISGGYLLEHNLVGTDTSYTGNKVNTKYLLMTKGILMLGAA